MAWQEPQALLLSSACSRAIFLPRPERVGGQGRAQPELMLRVWVVVASREDGEHVKHRLRQTHTGTGGVVQGTHDKAHCLNLRTLVLRLCIDSNNSRFPEFLGIPRPQNSKRRGCSHQIFTLDIIQVISSNNHSSLKSLGCSYTTRRGLGTEEVTSRAADLPEGVYARYCKDDPLSPA